LFIGFLLIASIDHQIIIHSHIQVQSQDKPIAAQALNATIQSIVSFHKIINATIKPYITADSTNAIHKTVITRK
jgi:hypothetical protein